MLGKISDINTSNPSNIGNLKSNLNSTSFALMIDEINDYLKPSLSSNSNWYVLKVGLPVIIVGRKSENLYVNIFRKNLENTFDYHPNCSFRGYGSPNLCAENWWTCFNDNDFCDFSKLKKIIRLLKQTEDEYSTGAYTVGWLVSGISWSKIGLHIEYIKLYIIFWNLFICALDDDIYNEQLPLVIELANCFNLDEHIMRDLCRGVEYVLSGKKLSPDCDLQCDTVECAKFFLGKEE